MKGLKVRTDPRRIAIAAGATAARRVHKLTLAEQAQVKNVWCANSHSLDMQGEASLGQLQEVSWKQPFAARTADWGSNGPSRLTPPCLGLVDRNPKFSLRISYRQTRSLINFQLAKMVAGPEMSVETGPATAQGPGTYVESLGQHKVRIRRMLSEDGSISEAVDAIDMLVQRGCHVPTSLFYHVLKRCVQSKDLASGRRVHALTVKSGYEGDAFLATHLIGLYASHRRLKEAMAVFTKVSNPDAYNWATIIFTYARHGEAAEAIQLYRKMCALSTVKCDTRLYTAVLTACAAAKDVIAGKEVHSHILGSSLKPDKFVQAGLVNMYAKCGCLEDARGLFDKLSVKNVVTWTSMIAAYAQKGLGQEALSLYSKMLQADIVPDSITYVCLLQACAGVGLGALSEGKQLHKEIEARGMDKDAVLGGSLVDMYAKCGSLEDARELFHKLPEKNIVAWTAMIAGYSQQGMGYEALNLYGRLQEEVLTLDSVTYVCLLQACASIGVGALQEGKQLHVQIQERGLENDAILGGSLVNMYAKCGSIGNARRVFDKLGNRTVVAWNAMIGGYAQQSMGKEALCLYNNMQHQGLTPTSATYVCLLQASAGLGTGALRQGKQLHAHIEKQGLDKNAVLGGSLINMYAKCGSLEDARRIFDELPDRNIVTWNVMIAGYAQQGMSQEALRLYNSLEQEGLTPNTVTYVYVLQACASIGASALDQGKLLHLQMRERCLEDDEVLGSSLVNMYAKCGHLEFARNLLDKLPERSTGAWTALIAGYAQQGMGQEALSLYNSMRQDGPSPNCVTYVCLLQACTSVGVSALGQGKQLHVQIKKQGLEEDSVLGGSLVNMYTKCGSLEDARRLFDKLSDRDVVTWTAMIAGYVKQGMGQEALRLFRNMQQEGLAFPNSVTYSCLLQACASIGINALHEGKQLHVQIDEQGMEGDAVIGGSLINMYAKCGSLEDARKLFDKLSERNVVTWTAMIAGYAQQGRWEEALGLYSSMQSEGLTPISATYICLLQACASRGLGALADGKKLHVQVGEQGLEMDAGLSVSLINMYSKCGDLEEARLVFDKLSNKDVVTWTSMIAGYAQQEMAQEALSLYNYMCEEGLTPDSVLYVCLLQACAAVVALPLGEQLHEEIKERGMQANCNVCTALVNMYAKCGNMYDAQLVFDSMSEKSQEAWGALVSGYAHQGDSHVVFDLVRRMTLEGIHPDEITLLSVLVVCSHVGLVEKGRDYFESMEKEYGICATMEHYISLVDLLGRAGHLHEALQTVKNMPFPPNDVVWQTLLGACQKWKNVDIGHQAFQGAISVDAKNATAYVLMSNIYASTQMWEAAKEINARRKKLGACKKPGRSWWTDMEGVMHTFLVGDKNHPDSESIYRRLEQLIPILLKEGYVPHFGAP